MKTLGNFLILGSLFFTLRIFYEPALSEIRYFFDQQVWGRSYVVQDTTQQPSTLSITPTPYVAGQGQLARFFQIPQVEALTPIDTDFAIVIPKIAANAHVIENVNPADDKAYLDALKKGVAHAAGTYLPGGGGHIFLFAHSTDYVWNVSTYNAIFYLLYKLQPGDEINIFYQGRRFIYIVQGSQVVDPTDIHYLTKQSTSEELTLQTCWPPGTTLKRLLVFAKPKAS